MKKKQIQLLVLTVLCCLVFTGPTFASDDEWTVEEAVKYALDHNESLKLLDNKYHLANLQFRNAEKNVNNLKSAEERLKDGINKLNSGHSDILKNEAELKKAKIASSQGYAVADIPISSGPLKGATIPSGRKVEDVLNAMVPPGTPNRDILIKGAVKQILSGQDAELKKKEKQLNEAKIGYDEALETLSTSKLEFKLKQENISSKIEDKMGYSTVLTYKVEDIDELMITMAGVNLDITKYAKSIYENQIAMLVSKNYYDALYTEKVMNTKAETKERGRQQYEMVKLSYENGMKSKDDYLLAKMFYDSTTIDYELAYAKHEAALLELKKNMNYDLSKTMYLQDSMIVTYEDELLGQGIESGLKNRIEIRKDLGAVTIAFLNENIVEDMYGYDNNAVTEAKYLTKAARNQLEIDKQAIEAEIRQSYQMMQSAGEMLKTSETLIADAEEVLKIAQLKYEQGLGSSNALMDKLNLSDSSGTMLEVIAAQENLADIKANVANIQYQYTMAKIKYYNDSGILKY